MYSAHTIVHVGINAPDSATTPMLLQIEEPTSPRFSLVVARYVRYMQREGHASYETITKDVRYIGLLYDYYVLVEKNKAFSKNNIPLLIEDFLAAFDKGAVLGWKAASKQAYAYSRSAIYQFCNFVFSESRLNRRLPNEEAAITEALVRSYNYSAHMKTSLLFHVKRHSSTERQKQYNKSRGMKRSISGAQSVKYFPPEYLPLMVEETGNIRDKIAILMLGYGGRRQSEILHIFVNDLYPGKNILNVKLAHPITSHMEWINRLGKKVSGTRAEYLKSMFNLRPRNDLGKMPKSVGWKGMKFDNVGGEYSHMYFLTEEVEKYLLYLHVRYMRETRSKFNHHPYYFVDQSGEPLSMRALIRLIDAACERIEKKYSINLGGRRGHSLRHHYGFYCADILQMDLMMIKKYMGHKQLSSTAIYTHISPEKARLAIADARDRAKLEGRIDATLDERLEIQKRFSSENKSISQLPDSWKRSWLTADDVDVMAMGLTRGVSRWRS